MSNTIGDEGTYGPKDGKLVLNDLTKQFGGLTAVDGLSLAVEEGEILAVIGPNGAGKSTTFNCATGFYKPTKGSVWYNGEEITGEPMYNIVNRGLARTFQSFRSFNDRSITDNIKLALAPNSIFSLSGLTSAADKQAAEICDRVGLGDMLDTLPTELPHAGMLRLEIARALACNPELILVDEPFAGLSNEEVDELSALFRQLRDNGITLAMIDHNMRGLLDLADRVVVLNFGKKLVEGSPAEIRENSEVQEAYFGGEAK